MSHESPKLYVHKPKKAQKHLQQQSRSSPSPSLVPSSSPPQLTQPPAKAKVTQPNESFRRRYKFLWPLLLVVNFSMGAYLFMRTKKMENIEEEVTAAGPTPTSVISTVSVGGTSERTTS